MRHSLICPAQHRVLLNAADPIALRAAEIGALIAERLGHQGELVGVTDQSYTPMSRQPCDLFLAPFRSMPTPLRALPTVTQ